LVYICGYELQTNLQNFTQKDLTEVKIFLKVLGGGLLFLKHPVYLLLFWKQSSASYDYQVNTM